MTVDALMEEINVAYRRLSAATEVLARADRELGAHGSWLVIPILGVATGRIAGHYTDHDAAAM
jgi:hypothetical protein